MSDLLTNIKQGLADDSIQILASPIVDEALALVSNNEIPFQKRVRDIYALVEQAAKAGGIEKERCGYVIESLYASASEDELIFLHHYKTNNRTKGSV